MPKTTLSRGWLRLIVFGALLTLATSLLPPRAHAQAAAGWGLSVSISQRDSERSTESDVAIDPQGFAHVAWYGGASDNELQVWYTNNRSGSFFTPKLVSNGSGDHEDVDVAVGSDGLVHIVVTRTTDSEINYIQCRNFGALCPQDNLSDDLRIVNLSNTDKRAAESSVAVDSRNNIYFAWIDDRNAEFRVHFRMIQQAQATTLVQVTRDTFDQVPQIAVTEIGGQTFVHIVYQGRPFGGGNATVDIFYTRGLVVGSGANATVAFEAPRQLSIDERNTFANNPSFATDGAGNLFVAFEQIINGDRDPTFMYSNNNGDSFTERNLADRSTQSRFPAVGYGLAFGRPTVSIAWEEGTDPTFNILTVNYDVQSNSFTSPIDRLSNINQTRRPAIGGRPGVNAMVATFNDNVAKIQIYFTSRDTGLGVTPLINGGAVATSNPNLNVSLTKIGQPTRLRYAVDRAPTASDPVIDFPAANAIGVPVPPSTSCERSVFVQASGDGVNFTAPTSDSIIVDTAVQATVSAANPGIGDPAFSRTPQAQVSVRPDAECTRIASTTPALGADGAGGFSGIISLNAPGPDGPRSFQVTVTDGVLNTITVTRQITVDTTAPVFTSGVLTAPTEALPGIEVDLRLDGVQISDNLYPGGFWGVEIANTLDPSANDGALVWTPVRAGREGGTVTIRDWSVVAGLNRPPGDPTLANTPIQVRLRFIDGAGNATSGAGVLRATVTLQSGYSTAQSYVPLLLRP